ncbi:MAG: hypothetical protein FJY91_02670 [Candidatus Harrisonbacteria bacterium]|nr:hypothetical protein [Candidatus Harrisonbacteria bacterium]
MPKNQGTELVRQSSPLAIILFNVRGHLERQDEIRYLMAAGHGVRMAVLAHAMQRKRSGV